MTTEPITSPLMHVHGVTTEAADFWFGLHAEPSIKQIYTKIENPAKLLSKTVNGSILV